MVCPTFARRATRCEDFLKEFELMFVYRFTSGRFYASGFLKLAHLDLRLASARCLTRGVICFNL